MHEKPTGYGGATSVPAKADLANVGLPRLVLETRQRLGPLTTPEEVAIDLQSLGMKATVEEVRDLWDEGHTDG